jgi:hypothetical protein
MHSVSLFGPLFRVSLVLLCLPFLFGCENQEDLVRKSWHDFHNAGSARDSQTAVGLISQSTIDFYERMRKAALEADEPEVRAMRYSDKMMVLLLRLRHTPEYLRTLTGAQVFMVSIQEGWDYGYKTIIPELLEIKIDGDTARGSLGMRGRSSGDFDYIFVKEGGVWKHDLTTMLDAMSDMMSQALRDKPADVQLDVDSLVLMTLREETGKEIPPDIWKKPKP